MEERSSVALERVTREALRERKRGGESYDEVISRLLAETGAFER